MDKKVKILYFAVNGSGQGVVFTSYPARDEHRKIWLGEMSGIYSTLVMQMESEELILLPVDMNWLDEPVRLEINLHICSEERR